MARNSALGWCGTVPNATGHSPVCGAVRCAVCCRRLGERGPAESVNSGLAQRIQHHASWSHRAGVAPCRTALSLSLSSSCVFLFPFCPPLNTLDLRQLIPFPSFCKYFTMMATKTIAIPPPPIPGPTRHLDCDPQTFDTHLPVDDNL